MRTFIASLVATLIAISLTAERVAANNAGILPVAYEDQDRFIRSKMREHIGYDPLLEVIAGCESTGNPHLIQHWEEDGSLVKNPTSSASGALQILLQYHSDWIESEGRDMYDIDDYMRFGRTIRNSQGYAAWNESRGCWGSFSHLGTS